METKACLQNVWADQKAPLRTVSPSVNAQFVVPGYTSIVFVLAFKYKHNPVCAYRFVFKQLGTAKKASSNSKAF